MKYFILNVSEDYSPPELKDWRGKLDRQTLSTLGNHDLPEHSIFYIDEDHMQTMWTDIILKPQFMVSKATYDCLKMYEKNLQSTRLLLSKPKANESRPYYLIHLPVIDAFTTESEIKPERVESGVINENKLQDRAIANVKIDSVSSCIVIREDLAESLLTHSAIGIGLQSLKVIRTNKNIRSRF